MGKFVYILAMANRRVKRRGIWDCVLTYIGYLLTHSVQGHLMVIWCTYDQGWCHFNSELELSWNETNMGAIGIGIEIFKRLELEVAFS